MNTLTPEEQVFDLADVERLSGEMQRRNREETRKRQRTSMSNKDLFGNDITSGDLENKFFSGNGDDKKHYWLTPPDLYDEMNDEFGFTFDPCPYPKPIEFDGLNDEWGSVNYVNPPFGSIYHKGKGDKKAKKKGMTAWARKAIEEYKKGKDVVLVFPVDKWILMLLEHCREVRNLGDVKWIATEDGSQGKGLGRHIAQFILTHDRSDENGQGKTRGESDPV